MVQGGPKLPLGGIKLWEMHLFLFKCIFSPIGISVVPGNVES